MTQAQLCSWRCEQCRKETFSQAQQAAPERDMGKDTAWSTFLQPSSEALSVSLSLYPAVCSIASIPKG